MFYSERLYSAPRKLPAMLDAGQSLAAMYQARLKHNSSLSTSASVTINGPQLTALECVYSCYLVTVSHFICNAASRTNGMRKTTQALTTQQIIEDYAGASNSLHTTSHSLASPNSTRSRSASTVFSEVEVDVELEEGNKFSSESGSRSGSGKFDLLSNYTQQNYKIENTEFGSESVIEQRDTQNHGNSTETDLHELFESVRSRTSSAFSTSFSSVFSTSISISKSVDMTTNGNNNAVEGRKINENDDIGLNIENQNQETASRKLSCEEDNGNLNEYENSPLELSHTNNNGKGGNEGNEGRGDADTYVHTGMHSNEIREVLSHREQRGSGEARERRGSGEVRERRGSGEARERRGSGETRERRGSGEARERRGSGEARERRGGADDDALITALRSLPLDISRIKTNHLPPHTLQHAQSHTQPHTPYSNNNNNGSSSSSNSSSRNQVHGHGRRVRTSTISPEDEAVNLAAAKLGLKVITLTD